MAVKSKTYVALNARIEQIIAGLSVEDACGQILCYDIFDKDDPAEVEAIVRRIKPGGIFVEDMPAEKVKAYVDMIGKYVKSPVIVSADVENGPIKAVKGGGLLPFPMEWGASATSRRCSRQASLPCA